jgi:hypothetical protein
MDWGWACGSFLGLDPIDSCNAVLSEAFAEVRQRRGLYDWLCESGNEFGVGLVPPVAPPSSLHGPPLIDGSLKRTLLAGTGGIMHDTEAYGQGWEGFRVRAQSFCLALSELS